MSPMEPPPVNPLFTARVNGSGQITIRSDVREEYSIVEGDKVAVFVMKKVMK